MKYSNNSEAPGNCERLVLKMSLEKQVEEKLCNHCVKF